MRPATADHRRKTPVSRNSTGLARITQQGGVIVCSCGWDKRHQRTKVREDAAEKHATEKHAGFAIWL